MLKNLAKYTQNINQPLNSLQNLRQEFDRIFDNFLISPVASELTRFWPDNRFFEVGALSPNINLSDDENAYFITTELPGVLNKDLEVNIDRGILTIKGHKEQKEEVKKRNYYKIESNYGSFQRSITLPDDIDENNIEAEFKNGLLEIKIAKSKEKSAQKQKIEVKAG